MASGEEMRQVSVLPQTPATFGPAQIYGFRRTGSTAPRMPTLTRELMGDSSTGAGRPGRADLTVQGAVTQSLLRACHPLVFALHHELRLRGSCPCPGRLRACRARLTSGVGRTFAQ